MKYKILCFFGKHDLMEVARLSSVSHLIGCIRCKKMFAMNTDVRTFLPFDLSFHDHYRMMDKKNYKKVMKLWDKWLDFIKKEVK